MAAGIDLHGEGNHDGETSKCRCSQWKGEGVEAHQFCCSYEVKGRRFALAPRAWAGRQWRTANRLSGALDEEGKGGMESRGWVACFEDAAAGRGQLRARGTRARREQATAALQRWRRDVTEGKERRWQVGLGQMFLNSEKFKSILTELNLFHSKDVLPVLENF
jgi:hypothetical protein